MLFSLFSLNSLHSLQLGIVFDTHESEGLPLVGFFAPFLLPGIVFDTRED